MHPVETHTQRLHRFQRQVQTVPAPFTWAPMADGMLYHLGQSLREQRKARKVKLVRVGAALDKSEASLSRFESGKTWPNDLDAAINAYADELDITPLEIWTAALAHWKAADRPKEVERQIAAAAGSPRPASRRTAAKGRASGRKRTAAK